MNQQTFDFVPPAEAGGGQPSIPCYPRCPRCGSTRIEVQVIAVSKMYDGRLIETDREDWGDESLTACLECDCESSYGAFYLAGKYKAMQEAK